MHRFTPRTFSDHKQHPPSGLHWSGGGLFVVGERINRTTDTLESIIGGFLLLGHGSSVTATTAHIRALFARIGLHCPYPVCYCPHVSRRFDTQPDRHAAGPVARDTRREALTVTELLGAGGLSAFPSGHANVTTPVDWGTGTYTQPKCSCGWMSAKAFRSPRFSDVTADLAAAVSVYVTHMVEVQRG